jgi:hypothetical protein
MKSAEPLPNKLEYDSRLVVNRLGEFYLCIPRTLEIQAENQGLMFQKVLIYFFLLYYLYYLTLINYIFNNLIGRIRSDFSRSRCVYIHDRLRFKWGKNDIGRTYRLYHTVHMTNSRASVIKFMEKEISENVGKFIY